VVSDHYRRRIAELEQVLKELRQTSLRHTRSDITMIDPEKGLHHAKRRVIVDRFARFKIDEAVTAQVEAAAKSSGNGNGTDAHAKGPPVPMFPPGKDNGGEPYCTNPIPGEEIVHDRSGRRTFLGAPAGRSLLRRVGSRCMFRC